MLKYLTGFVIINLIICIFVEIFSRCCDKKSCGNRNETPSDPVIIDRYVCIKSIAPFTCRAVNVDGKTVEIDSISTFSRLKLLPSTLISLRTQTNLRLFVCSVAR